MISGVAAWLTQLAQLWKIRIWATTDRRGPWAAHLHAPQLERGNVLSISSTRNR